MKEGYSKPRNRAIAYAFAYMKIIEKWGSGIPRMLRECSEYGLPEPEFIDFDGDFRVNMYRKISRKFSVNSADTNDTNGTIGTKVIAVDANNHIDDVKILSLIQENPVITQRELVEKLQISLRTVKRLMADLQKRGVIERQGSNRKGKWIIIRQQAMQSGIAKEELTEG